MKNMKISERIQKDVLDYINLSQTYLDSQKELETFLTTISPQIKMDVIEYMFSWAMINAFDGVGTLTQQKNVVAYVTRSITTEIQMPEDFIIT